MFVISWLSKVCKGVSEFLLFDEDYKSHIDWIKEMLTRCCWCGITLNKDRFVVAAPSVTFFGYTLPGDGITVEDIKTADIRDTKQLPSETSQVLLT